MTLVRGMSGLAILFFASMSASGAEPLPRDDGLEHMGAATCASNQCHGNPRPDPAKSNVLLNESLRWDGTLEVRGNLLSLHYKSYTVLREPPSVEMARRLGLPNAHEAKICLDCHADNVKAERRGKKFQLNEGVSCEACHGGAQKWIKSHTEKDVTHNDNIQRGLYPTESPLARARLCIACHFGDDTQFATHRIMAAGHPRLTFDLAVFSDFINHWEVDADYVRRKGEFDKARMWALGTLETARATLRVISGPVARPADEPLEWALYDCHGCHRAIDDKPPEKLAPTAETSPGLVRLNDSAILLSAAVASFVDETPSSALLSTLRQLQQSASRGKSSGDAVNNAEKILKGLEDRVEATKFDQAATRKLLIGVLALGSQQDFRDFADAQSSYRSLLALTSGNDLRNLILGEMKQMKVLVESSTAFDPKRYKELMRVAQSKAAGPK